MSISFTTVSNRCWHLLNGFTKFTAQVMVHVIADTVSCHLRDFTYKFHINILRILQQFFDALALWLFLISLLVKFVRLWLLLVLPQYCLAHHCVYSLCYCITQLLFYTTSFTYNSDFSCMHVLINCLVSLQEALLSQRGNAMLCVCQ